MGGEQSKITTGGTLQGAVGPALAVVPKQNLPSFDKKVIRVSVPKSVKHTSDGTATMKFDGSVIKIPKGLKKGDTFPFKQSKVNPKEVFASTLPSVPGMDIVQSKPIVWGSVSYSFYGTSQNQQSMGGKVGKLLKDAQEKIIEQVVKRRCNACLGMTFNVTNDSSGGAGQEKLVVVTACGTPCIIVPSAQARAVEASVVGVDEGGCLLASAP